MEDVIVVGGSTASGKTELAVRLAEQYNGEVISADSLLIYKGLNIGTAKPTKEEMRGIPHYMIDVVSPQDSFSVSDYERLAMPILQDILSRGKRAIICGGTGFYIKSLLFKSGFGNSAGDPAVREKYEAVLQERGVEYLHALLKECDKESAEKLHPNDVKRVIRALEIFEITGKKKSDQQDKEEARFPYFACAINWDREVLYSRINARVDEMFKNGLVEEVEGLRSQGITLKNQCMQGIGYKEFFESEDLEIVKESIKKNTRNYAKRQITFFKKFPSIQWINKDDIL